MAFEANDDLRWLPAYSVDEAAHYLRMPEETLRSWIVGRFYPSAGQLKRSRPVKGEFDRISEVQVDLATDFDEPPECPLRVRRTSVEQNGVSSFPGIDSLANGR